MRLGHISEHGATSGPGRWENLTDDEMIRESAYQRGYHQAILDHLNRDIEEAMARARRPWWRFWA